MSMLKLPLLVYLQQKGELVLPITSCPLIIILVKFVKMSVLIHHLSIASQQTMFVKS